MKLSKMAIIAAFLTITAAPAANAQSLSDLFGNSGSTIGNILEGVFSSSNISVADMAGTWTSTGPAVCFQGEGFLKKAGGIATATALENKLEPYYSQYGLNNAVLTVDDTGNFTLKASKVTLKGTITADSSEQGVFQFEFKALGTIKLGSVKTYVQKTSQSMEVMFDATKLKSLLSGVAKFTGISLAETLSSLLDSYDGLCIGFRFGKTGSGTTNSTTVTNSNGTTNSDSNNNVKDGVQKLFDVFNNASNVKQGKENTK